MPSHRIPARVGILLSCCLAGLPAQEAPGTSAQGISGGLVIPTARVLPEHALAWSFGNHREPRFGPHVYERNFSFGMGFLSHVEIFGRLADYNSTPYGDYLNLGPQPDGPRDLSANVKLRIPFLPKRGPQLALGANDLGGAASKFSSTYVVATQRWRSVSASLGYARDGETDYWGRAFHGVFGGLQWDIESVGLSLLAEHDGQASHAGGRWWSPELERLGGLRMGATLQRSFGAEYPDGDDADAFSYAVNLQWEVGRLDARRGTFEPKRSIQPGGHALANGNEPTTAATRRSDTLAALRVLLEEAGLERVRVGLRDQGAELVVEYENHRYAHNEVDALGIVLGLAAESAPGTVRSLRAVTLKDGLRIHETTVPTLAYRDFVQTGAVASARESLVGRSGSSGASSTAEWEREEPSRATRLRVEIRPGLNYTVGTELGLFDYSLAARPRVTVPLWPGARLTSAWSLPLYHTPNLDEGQPLAFIRHRRGLETAHLGQNLTLGRWFLWGAAAGRFHFDSWGLQSELMAFVPKIGDAVRLRGALYAPEPGGIEGGDRVGSVSYRRFWGPATWTELGWQLYGDGTAGPTFEWTRWSSDVAVTLFGRRGGENTFAGLKLTAPLTPRRGMKPSIVTLSGPGQHSQSLRTQVQAVENSVAPGQVRELALETDLDGSVLNGGRMNQAYLRSQLYRMREAYLRYAPEE